MSEEARSEYVFDYKGWAVAMSKAVGPAWSYGLYKAISKVMHKRKRQEVVRCKDCADCDMHSPMGRLYVCKRFDSFWHETEPDGFCAWGLRREVDE